MDRTGLERLSREELLELLAQQAEVIGHHLSYERLVEICRDVFGLAISQGGVEHALQRWVEQARPTYAAIREKVRGRPVINSDETSARVAGRNHWQWVFQTPEAGYHVIAPGRGGEVIDAFLAGAELEVWGSDLWAPQVLTAASEHQICLSHQERDLTFARNQGRNLLDSFRAVAGPSLLQAIPARA